MKKLLVVKLQKKQKPSIEYDRDPNFSCAGSCCGVVGRYFMLADEPFYGLIHALRGINQTRKQSTTSFDDRCRF